MTTISTSSTATINLAGWQMKLAVFQRRNGSTHQRLPLELHVQYGTIFHPPYRGVSGGKDQHGQTEDQTGSNHHSKSEETEPFDIAQGG